MLSRTAGIFVEMASLDLF